MLLVSEEFSPHEALCNIEFDLNVLWKRNFGLFSVGQGICSGLKITCHNEGLPVEDGR